MEKREPEIDLEVLFMGMEENFKGNYHLLARASDVWENSTLSGQYGRVNASKFRKPTCCVILSEGRPEGNHSIWNLAKLIVDYSPVFIVVSNGFRAFA